MPAQWLAKTLALGTLLAYPLVASIAPAADRTPDLFQRSTVQPGPSRKQSPSLFKQPPPAPAATPLSLPLLEQAVYDQVNQHRAELGLRPLRLDARISAEARAYSQAMADKRLPFGHSDFRRRVRRIDRLISSRRVSETVAYIFTHNDPATRAVQGWINSPHHRPVLEGNYSITGIGIAQGERGALYFTQIYVRPR